MLPWSPHPIIYSNNTEPGQVETLVLERRLPLSQPFPVTSKAGGQHFSENTGKKENFLKKSIG